MDNYYASYWPTIRGCDSSAMKLMEGFVNSLSLEISAATPPPPQNVSPISSGVSPVLKKQLLSDVDKTLKEKLKQAGDLNSFSISTSGDHNEFHMVIALNHQKENDSGLNDSGDFKTHVPFAFNPPKSEATQTEPAERPADSDGFWVSSDDEPLHTQGKIIIYFF